ncbi:MAG: acyl carrier protein [Gemmatimonadetes bacterium]|nr:acyl carrier protein [Gemmatimonadota bacterium]
MTGNGNAATVLENIFRSVFRLPTELEADSLAVGAHGDWDSIAHLNLILAIEQEFRIMLTPEEASAAQSFADMLDLVRRKTEAR